MSSSKKLKDRFIARDALGNEFEVSVYVDASTADAFGHGTASVEGFASAEALALTGPFRGQTFDATYKDGNYYVSCLGEPTIITRIP